MSKILSLTIHVSLPVEMDDYDKGMFLSGLNDDKKDTILNAISRSSDPDNEELCGLLEELFKLELVDLEDQVTSEILDIK